MGAIKRFLEKLLDILFGSWLRMLATVFVIYFTTARIFFVPTASMEDTYKAHSAIVATLFDYGISNPYFPFIEIPLIPVDFNDGHILDWGTRPQRGDVVIFRNPLAPSVYYVKRVFAVEGDEVEFSCKGIYLKRPEDNKFILDPYKKVYSGIKYGETNTTMYNINKFKHDREAFELAKKAKAEANSTELKSDKWETAKTDEEMKSCEVILNWKVEKDTFFMVGDNRDGSFDSRYFGAVPYKYLIGKVRWQIF